MKLPQVDNILTLAAIAIVVNGGVRAYAIHKGHKG